MSTSSSYKIEVIAKDGEVIYSQTVHEETAIGHVLEVDANQEYMYTNGVCEIPQSNGQVYRVTRITNEPSPIQKKHLFYQIPATYRAKQQVGKASAMNLSVSASTNNEVDMIGIETTWGFEKPKPRAEALINITFADGSLWTGTFAELKSSLINITKA